MPDVSLPQEYLLPLALLVGFGVLLLLARLQGRHSFREIPAFRAAKDAASQSLETGQAVHLGLGVGGIGTDLTADSLAAVEIAGGVVNRVGLADRLPIITVADPTLLPMVQDRVNLAARTHSPQERAACVRWTSPDPAAYAVEVMGILAREQVQSSLLAGSFGNEYLLPAGAGSLRGIRQIGGASNPVALPLVYATSDENALGEELFAAGAFMGDKPWHMSSLKAEDWMRWALALAIGGALIVNILA